MGAKVGNPNVIWNVHECLHLDVIQNKTSFLLHQQPELRDAACGLVDGCFEFKTIVVEYDTRCGLWSLCFYSCTFLRRSGSSRTSTGVTCGSRCSLLRKFKALHAFRKTNCEEVGLGAGSARPRRRSEWQLVDQWDLRDPPIPVAATNWLFLN